jgi:hypothetical protein
VLGYTAEDVDRLTLGDFNTLCRWLDTYIAETKRAGAQ